MSQLRIDWRSLLTRFLHSWQAPALAGLVVLLIVAVWLMPRRTERIVPVDGTESWDARHAPPRRQIVWQPAAEIAALVPPDQQDDGELFTPRLADGGATLYYTRRAADGQADIFRARLVDGAWRPGEPVAELNTAANEIGPVVTRDGRELYFYSNRAGGFGGYDLYVSRRTESGWGPPQNLGPTVNTPAHEYDPAVAPDGQSLYFASNRTPEMAARTAHAAAGSPDPATGSTEDLPQRADRPNEAANRVVPEGDLRSARGAGSGDPRTTTGDPHTTGSGNPRTTQTRADWATTLRAHPGQTTFDLYIVRREEANATWQPAAALAELNRPDTNEGAPFVAPNGAFLYFASDRPARPGEERNLDLYRARRIGERFAEPENLGTSVNTAAHETEPALSPEGFTLVFSSNRTGGDRIFQSTAEEVYEISEWDAARLSALGRFWWLALLITLLAAALIAAFLYYRGRLFEKAYAARFFLGSVLVHLLLLLLLAAWTLPTVVEMITTKLHKADPATELFDDNQHQSHEDGREAYEKLADLKSLEKVPVPEIVRQETSPQSVPERTDNPLPTIPESVARALPPKQVLFVPPKRPEPLPTPQPQQQPAPLVRRSPVQPAKPLEIAEVPEELMTRAVERPAEAALESTVELTRQQAAAVETTAPPQSLAKTPATTLRPSMVEIDDTQRPTEQFAPPRPVQLPLERSLRGIAVAAVVEPMDEAVILAANAPLPKETDLAPAAAVVERAAASAAPPSPQMATPTVDLEPLQSARFASDTSDLNEPAATANALSATPAPAALPKSRRVAPPTTIALAEEPVAPAAADSQSETAPAETEVALARNGLPEIPFTAPAAKELTGPATRDKHRLIIGVLSEERNDAPPTFNPLASRLDRRRARATRVAFAEDNVGLRSMFTLRQGDTRRQHIEIFGGSDESEKAVDRGLEWLAAHQNADGSWSLNKFHENCTGKHPACTGAGSEASNCAATGFALLPFLAAGHTHQSGKYQKTVAEGLKWMVDHQKPDGDLLAPGDGQHMYSHGIAAIALCEAFGMSQDEEFRQPAQLSLDFITKAQHGPSGGWRYKPNESADTSVVGWQMMALKSGEMAGLSVSQSTLENAARWLSSVEANQPTGGTFGYTGRSPTPAMTAEALLCLQFQGAGRNTPRMLAGADYLLAHLPEPKQQLTSYYWYYGTQMMYHMQGKYWEAWNERLRDLLVETQIKEGHLAGTWDPRDQWENRAGRLYATSLKLLILEVYYRHLPLYEQLED